MGLNMKQKYIIRFFLLVLFLLCISIIVFFKCTTYDKDKLKESFLEWENGEISSEHEKSKIINRLNNYLSKYSDISNEEILDICDSFKIIEKNNLCIIQYIENTLFYGASAKASYQIAMYDSNVKTIINNGTIYIDEIRQTEDNTYYIYGSNYQFSNIAGIIALRLSIQNNKIEITKNVISKDNLPAEYSFEFGNSTTTGPYDFVETLYYKDTASFYIKDISEDGTLISFTLGDLEHRFNLENDGFYHFQENED